MSFLCHVDQLSVNLLVCRSYVVLISCLSIFWYVVLMSCRSVVFRSFGMSFLCHVDQLSVDLLPVPSVLHMIYYLLNLFQFTIKQQFSMSSAGWCSLFEIIYSVSCIRQVLFNAFFLCNRIVDYTCPCEES